MEDMNLKQMREKFQSLGIFYTPTEVAKILKDIIGIDKPREVYDPTVGSGALLAVYDDDVPKYGQELRQEALDLANETLKNFEGYCGDTLADPHWFGKKFHVIISNPPFSVKWDRPDKKEDDPRFAPAPALAPKSKADMAFWLHILHYLADDGVAMIVDFPGTLYRGNAEQKIRQWFVEQNYIDQVISFPAGLFTDTSISVIGLVIKKNRETTDIKFWDYENNLERMVSREEIEKEKYNLSVSTYVALEVVKEEINFDEVASDLRSTQLAGFINQMKFSATAAALSGDTETVDAIEQFLQLVRQFDFTVKEYDTSGFKRGEYKELGNISSLIGFF